MKSIQVLKPKFRKKEILEHIEECLDKTWTGMGFKTVEFEEKWKEYTGHKYAHFLNSATSGLHLAIWMYKHNFNWQDGDEVITTPMTFVSTNHSIVYERLKPVFADVDDTLTLNPEAVKKAITPKTKAIMFVAIGGNLGNYEEIIKIARDNNLRFIFDAAHASGTKLNGKHVEVEDVAIYSFQAVKNLPTSDSGLICFKEESDDKLARQMTWLGIDKDTFSRTTGKGEYKFEYEVPNVGFKYHGNSIIASMALVALKYLEEDNKRREEIVKMYRAGLEGAKGIKFIQIGKNCTPSFHLFQIIVEKRDDLLSFLNENGVFPGVHYVTNTKYKPYSYGEKNCPNARYYSDRLLTLPIHLHLTNEEIKYVIDKTLSFLNA